MSFLLDQSLENGKVLADIQIETFKQNPYYFRQLYDNNKEQSFELCVYAVVSNESNWNYVNHPTKELGIAIIHALYPNDSSDFSSLCLRAVKEKGIRLRYIEDQWEDLCLEAIQSSYLALQYVKHQTPEICLAAVKKSSEALKYVHEQSEEICLTAIQTYPKALKYVKNQNEKICKAALDRGIFAFPYIHNKTHDLYLYALQKSLKVIEFFDDDYYKKTNEEVCNLIKDYCEVNGNSIEEIFRNAIRKDSKVFCLIPKPSEDLCFEAVRYDWNNLQYVNDQSERVVLAAIKQNGNALQYANVNYRSNPEICIKAIKKNPEAIYLVNSPTKEMWELANRLILLEDK